MVPTPPSAGICPHWFDETPHRNVSLAHRLTFRPAALSDYYDNIFQCTEETTMQAPVTQALLKDGALAGEWALDPGTSSIRLTSKVYGLIPVNGVFGEVSGNGTVSPDGEAGGTLTIAVASIDTRNTRRDTHLRSADFFDSENHPDITFTADRIRPSGQDVAVAGVLTVRGRTRPLSFDASVSVHGDGEIWLDAEVRINRADFGLTWNWLGMVSMTSTIAVHAVFTRR
jgi:polyisoprenoid-binding protein YceI